MILGYVVVMDVVLVGMVFVGVVMMIGAGRFFPVVVINAQALTLSEDLHTDSKIISFRKAMENVLFFKCF